MSSSSAGSAPGLALASGILFGAVCLALGPVLFPAFTVADGDLLNFFPYLYQGPWAGLWRPFTSLGTPTLPNPQAGYFYPPAWALALDFQGALGPYLLGHLTLAGVGAFLWLRRIAGPGWGALLGALMVAIGGPALSLITKLDKLPGYTWLPFFLWGLDLATRSGDRDARSDGRAGIAIASGALALTLFGGSVEGVAIALLAGVICALPGGAGRMRRLGVTLGICALGLALSGALLVPFIHAVAEAARGDGVSAARGLARSTHPMDLLGWIAHTPFWELASGRFLGQTQAGAQRPSFLLSLYGGLPLIAIAGIGLLRGLGQPWARASLIGVCVFGALALGAYNPLYVWAYDTLPGLKAVRYPEKWWLGTVPFQGALIALGWARLKEDGRRGGELLLLGGLAAALLGLCALVVDEGPLRGGVAGGIGPCLALVGAGAILHLRDRGRLSPALGMAALLAMLALDFTLAGRGMHRILRVEEGFPPTATGALLAREARGAAAPPRIWTEDPRPGIALPEVETGAPFARMIHDIGHFNTAIGAGVAYVYGGDPLRSARVEAAARRATVGTLPERRRIVARLGGDLWIIWSQARAMEVAQALGLEPVPGVPGWPLLVGILRDPEALPRVRWAGRARMFADRDSALDAMAQGISAAVAIGVRGDRGADLLGALPAGEGALPLPDAFSAAPAGWGAWRVDYGASVAGVILLGEAFSRGWAYRLDGGSWAEAGVGDVCLVAIPAPAGRHRIEARYRPPGLGLGIALSLMALGILVAIPLRARRGGP